MSPGGRLILWNQARRRTSFIEIEGCPRAREVNGCHNPQTRVRVLADRQSGQTSNSRAAAPTLARRTGNCGSREAKWLEVDHERPAASRFEPRRK